MLGDMFLWPVANLKQGVIYFIKQALTPNISAGSVSLIVHHISKVIQGWDSKYVVVTFKQHCTHVPLTNTAKSF